MSDALGIERKGAIARITLRQPPLNILDIAMLQAMTEAVLEVSKAEDVRLLRIDAEGKVFCAGVDVGDHMGDSVGPMMETLDQLFAAFARVSAPTVALVHGAALGGGCELALATDLCLAAERAAFGLPEIRLGVFAPPASILLPRIVGERRALGMLLMGETIPAAEAERLGIVNRVFPDDSFAADSDEWLTRLLELSGTAQRHAKRAVIAARDKPFDVAHRDLTRQYLDELMKTHDANEGLQSFIEKRRPVWKHR